jgi:hypothetical protein
VLEKDKANFCDYFSVGGGGKKEITKENDIKKKLEELFKKK